MALERSLGVPLFERDRRHVALSSADVMLLPDAREILALAEQAKRRLGESSGVLRLGYVSWLPDELVGSISVDLRVDEWVMPSHVQIARVLDGGLDAAVAWAPAVDERLHHELLWAEPLDAMSTTGVVGDAVVAADLAVLVDTDLTSWDARNAFATEFSEAVDCRLIQIDDGGITGTFSPSLPTPERSCARLPQAPSCVSARRVARPSDPRSHPSLVLVAGHSRQ